MCNASVGNIHKTTQSKKDSPEVINHWLSRDRLTSQWLGVLGNLQAIHFCPTLSPFSLFFTLSFSFVPLVCSSNEYLLCTLVPNLDKFLSQFFQYSKYCVPFHGNNTPTKDLLPLLKQEIRVFILGAFTILVLSKIVAFYKDALGLSRNLPAAQSGGGGRGG